MSSNSEHRSELRLRTRTTLDNLEVKDLCNQSSIGLQRTCDRCSTPADLCLVLKETLSGLSCANTQARRLRYKAAAAAISQRAAEWVGSSVPSLVKHVLDRIGQEEHQSNQEELAGLLKALAVAAVAYNAGHEGQQKEDDWFGKLLTEPLLRAAASGPSKQRVASGCTMVHAVLTAVLEWANYPPVISASVDCLKTTLHYLNTGLLVPRVPEVFLPLKQCIEILGANLQPRSAQAILDQCLQGIRQKEDWQMRRQAVETFITLAAAVQVHKPSEGGQWHLEHTPCIEVLVRNKTAILNALTDAKYDKITHVRQAVGKALIEMDCIPSPKSSSRLAAAPSGEDSDLESVLANKKAKSNSRPWSGASTESGGSGEGALRNGGNALEEDGDEHAIAPSPRSDMGSALEPEQDDGDSPTGNSRQGCEAQPLHDSLQAKHGSRRRWAGNASATLNRSSAGGKGSSRTPLSHVSGSTGLGKTAPPAGSSSVKQRKENLTPARPRHSFVKPKKQVFADFGVQVFAPLPRAISPEREVPQPVIPDEEDDSPVGPLKVQLPDLRDDSDKGRVTVLMENQQDGQSEQEPHASAESSEESDQQDRASVGPTTGSKEGTQEAEGIAKSGNPAELSAHTGSHETNERAEAGPDVHVDKPAGIISIANLPPGSSIRLVGLQHSLYEHPVKVEISAPSARGVDHFSYSLADDRASHQALHAAQQKADRSQPQPSTPKDASDASPQAQRARPDDVKEPSSHTPADADGAAAAEGTPVGQQQAAALHEQQTQSDPAQHQTPSQQPQHAQQAGAPSMITPPGSHAFNTYSAQHGQHQGNSPGLWESPGPSQQGWSGSAPASMTNLPGSSNKQELQQQLLQQLAAQAGFHLVPPPSQSPVMSMSHTPTHQPVPLLNTPPHYQQQLQQHLPMSADAGFSQGVLQHMGLGLQSSAMQMVQMQQQQQQASRLPAWAQQALMPQQHHYQQQLSPAFSPQPDLPRADPSHMTQGLPPNGLFGQFAEGQFADGPHFPSAEGVDAHDQFGPGHTASLRASQGVGSWQAPQQQQQATANDRTPWLSPPLHHPGTTNSMHNVSGAYQQEEEVYWMYEGQTLPQHPISADSRQLQWQHDAWHPEASGGLEADMQAPGSVQGSAQGNAWMPPVLSGASSGLSSPLRESGHLESLLEVNSRVEAAMDRARAQLQGSGSFSQPAADASHDRVPRESQADMPSQAGQGPQEGQSQRAKPRGLPSTVQSTVDRIAANTGPSTAVHSKISAESSSAMSSQAQATEEQGQVAIACCEADSASLDTALVGALAQGSPYGSPNRGPRGQGKPPLSPVRQSLQDLVLSRESSPSEHALVPVSLAPVMGMPKQDMNVHCNPLFTDPLAGQPDAHDSPAQKQIADTSDLSHSEQHQQHQKKAIVSASAGALKVAGQRAVLSSPPSQLQRSLRAIMQQHAEELEDF